MCFANGDYYTSSIQIKSSMYNKGDQGQNITWVHTQPVGQHRISQLSMRRRRSKHINPLLTAIRYVRLALKQLWYCDVVSDVVHTITSSEKNTTSCSGNRLHHSAKLLRKLQVASLISTIGRRSAKSNVRMYTLSSMAQSPHSVTSYHWVVGTARKQNS